MWDGIIGIIREIRSCENAEATMAAVTMAFVCIDAMAFLNMPSDQISQTRNDFINWVNTYLQADQNQPYQYNGIDVYAARCSLLHTFGAEANLHRNNQNINKFGYHDGGQHAYNPEVSPNLVIIGAASFLNDVIIAVENFMRACQQDNELFRKAEARLPTLYQSMPFPNCNVEAPNNNP